MKKLILIAMFGFLAISRLTAEGGVDFSGEVQTTWGVGAPWTDKDTSAGRLLLGDTSLNGKLDVWYDKSSALAEGSVSYDAIIKKLNFTLNELWLDYTDSFWGIRIGRQKAAWGKADGVDITNVLCPTDMSSFAAMTSDDSKLAIDALRLSLNTNQFTADVYWIPFLTPAVLPLEQENPLRKFVVPASYDLTIEALNQTLTIPVSIGDIDKPETALWNSEFGARLSGYFSAFDVSLYGFYGWDDVPVLEYKATMSDPTPQMPFSLPDGIVVNGVYKRMAMIGVDAAIPIRNIVLRTEAAFFPQRYFAAEGGSAKQRNELSALAGLDWMPDGWTITAQYFCDVVFGELETIDREEAYTHGATLSLSKSLLNETLEASFSGLMNFQDFDSLISPSVNYSISDQIKLETGAYIFIPGPDKDGKYGAYKDLSTIYLKAKYSF